MMLFQKLSFLAKFKPGLSCFLCCLKVFYDKSLQFWVFLSMLELFPVCIR